MFSEDDKEREILVDSVKSVASALSPRLTAASPAAVVSGAARMPAVSAIPAMQASVRKQGMHSSLVLSFAMSFVRLELYSILQSDCNDNFGRLFLKSEIAARISPCGVVCRFCCATESSSYLPCNHKKWYNIGI